MNGGRQDHLGHGQHRGPPEEEHGFGLSSRQMLLDVGSGLHRTGGERELSLISKGKKR